jgi:hypothetical protein
MTAPLRRALVGAVAAASIVAPAAPAAAVEPPMVLPGDAGAARVEADHGTWIVGAKPVPAAHRIARRHEARRIGPRATGGYVVARRRAATLAAALKRRALLVYAQPNTLARRAQAVPADPLTVPPDDAQAVPADPLTVPPDDAQAVPADPLTVPPDDWRARVADPSLVPPPVHANSPLIALVDSQLDPAHPEFQGGATTTLLEHAVTDSHGTATASIAAAPVNGIGIAGVWPGARALNVPLPQRISCARSADRIGTAIERRAAVISMSYGSSSPCFAEYVALQFAVARGIVPVAAAGNEFTEGNHPQFPASLPHVLTVAAVGYDLRSSFFSNANSAIDLSAFGEGVMTAVPPSRDLDGVADGYERQTGTSFAAPMVAAAAAWVTAARPRLSADQVAQAIRLSATDLATRGWDRNTGFGLLSLGAALTRRPTRRDPAEPNDDMVWVDGRAFRRPDGPIYTGRRPVRLHATLDSFEDPADVYRVRLRPRTRVRVSADPSRRDDVALAAFRGRARSLESRTIARSGRRGRRTERLTIGNRSRRTQAFYVAVRVQRGARDLDAAYALRVG